MQAQADMHLVIEKYAPKKVSFSCFCTNVSPQGMVQLCHLHQSEFIRRLILVFDYSSREPKGRYNNRAYRKLLIFSDTRKLCCN